jgi:hypothetical protein
MNTQTSQVSRHARYIGRVGALAAALGIGLMVGTTPGVASADSTAAGATSPGGATDTNGGSSTGTGAGTSDTGVGASTGASTAGTGSSSTTTGTSGSTASGNTTTSGTTSSIEVAPGVSISANSVKIGKHTVTLGLAALKPAAKSPELPGAIEPSGGSTPTVDPAPETEQTASSLLRTGSKSTHPAAANSATSSLSTAASKLANPVGVVDDALKSVKQQLSAAATGSGAVPTAQPFKLDTAARAFAAPLAAAAVAPAAPAAQVAQVPTGVVGILNQVVTNLLNPFLGPAPKTPVPGTPVVWAVLGWVRRNLFNQAPTIKYDPTTTTQTGQTVTGNVGATDPEGDPLTYTVTSAPTNGTVTIDQKTGNFTYTPNDINYEAVQTDSFTVSVTDGTKVNLLGLTTPRTATQTIDVAVQPPTALRTVVPLPAGFTDAAIPRFAADGKSLLFSATPPGSAADARREIYQVNVDGTGLTCITCGLADPTPPPAGAVGVTTPDDLFKPVPFEDGSGRILMQSVATSGTNSRTGQSVAGSYTNVIYDPNTNQLVRVITPPGKPGVVVVDPQREMRISPDGTHVLFSQIQLVPSGTDAPGFTTAVPIVGTLTYDPVNNVYNITDARVVYPVGEGKQFTHDGKGVIVQGGLYDSGNVDDVEVDLATGNVTRLTGNLDYDEDADLSPNGQWLAIDSGRGQDMLTPASEIERPAFVPLLIQGSVYTAYAGTSNSQNVTNQPWVIAVNDDLNGENGIPLFVNGDGWVARSMPSWNADGTEVAFWEADASDPTGNTSRLVVDKLEYTTSVGTAADKTTPALSSSFPTLTSNTPQQVKLIDPGTYAGAGGGTAVVTQTTDAATGHIIRTVQYTNYVNDEGMILNGAESTDQSAAQNTIHYTANVQVTGTHTGSLTGDVTINKLTRVITPTTANSQITSTLDGNTLVLLDPARLAASRAAV